MSQFTINAETRNDLGKGASRRLRRANLVPAVIYGGGQDPQPISLQHHEIIKALEEEAFYTSILDVKIDGKDSKAVVKDIQRHAFKPKVMHMDLQRVNANEKIHMHVPIHFIGGDVAPGVKAGGLITHNMNDIEVVCLPKDLPEFIELNISNLNIGDTLHISDLPLPAGVASVELSHGADHDQPVVGIHKARGMSEDEATGGEAGASPEAKPE